MTFKKVPIISACKGKKIPLLGQPKVVKSRQASPNKNADEKLVPREVIYKSLEKGMENDDLEPIPLKLKRFGADSVTHKDKTIHLNINGNPNTHFPMKKPLRSRKGNKNDRLRINQAIETSKTTFQPLQIKSYNPIEIMVSKIK